MSFQTIILGLKPTLSDVGGGRRYAFRPTLAENSSERGRLLYVPKVSAPRHVTNGSCRRCV